MAGVVAIGRKAAGDGLMAGQSNGERDRWFDARHDAARLRQEYARVRMPVETAVRDRDEQPFVPLVERFLSSAAK